MTARGLADARAELDELGRTGGDADRIRELSDHLATAQVGTVDDPAVVGFGAAVTVAADDGTRTTYHIVGAIESDPKRGRIAWQTPLAAALWGARVGDSIDLPKGGEAEVVAIEYAAE